MGYQSEDGETGVAVLLIRKGGAGEPVKASLMIGDDGDGGDDSATKKSPSRLELTMRIDGKSLGFATVRLKDRVGDLTEAQLAALLKALHGSAEIEWSTKEQSWRVSGKGASAVLLKMDEFQGRLGTTGAIFKKGPQDEARVLPALPLPVVMAAAVANPKTEDNRFVAKHRAALRKSLAAVVQRDDCPMLAEGQGKASQLVATRLSDTKLLIGGLCWQGAYNDGLGYWVVEEAPPYQAALVTTSGSEYQNGTISSEQKDRGVGDCWSSDVWTWDGKQFVHTSSSSTGLCKGIGAGGAWSLPTIVTDVRPVIR